MTEWYRAIGGNGEGRARALAQPCNQLRRLQIAVDREHQRADPGNDRRRKAGADVKSGLICIGVAAGGCQANKIRLLYGGSVKAGNAIQLFAMADIDGGLIGGASLIADDFVTICRAASLS